MNRSDYRTLLDRGRKAGLRTSELYVALSTRPPERQESVARADGNGFVPTIDVQGHRSYQPDGPIGAKFA